MFDPRTSKRVEVPVLHRAQMRPGDSVAGPALITEAQTTTVVSSSFNATIDARGYIVMSRDGDHDQ
jgi:N-methylhydantoinase A